jgi:hypothetical protein
MSVAAAFHGMSADSPAGGLPAGGGVAPLANIPDRQRRDGFPRPVIRREYSVIAMPVLPRRRHEIGEPVEELKRRELDDAIGPRSRGRSLARRRQEMLRLLPHDGTARLKTEHK